MSTLVPTALPIPVVIPLSHAAVWLATAAVLALAVYYFIGVDQGAMSATEAPLPLTGPGGTIVHPVFPADDLFQFRFYSVVAQLILWTAIGLLFAPLADRLLNPAAQGRETATV